MSIKKLFIGKLHEVARGHYERHAFRHAEAAYKLILRLDPNDGNARYWLGDCRLQTGDCDAAIEEFNSLRQVFPNNVSLNVRIAESHLEAQRYEEALDSTRRALELDAAHPDALLTLGTVFHHLGRFSEAVECFRRVLELRSDSSEACVAMGRLEFDSGRKSEGICWFERAAELSPDTPGGYDCLAEAQYYTDVRHPHIQHMNDLTRRGQLPPKDAMGLHFTLGDIYHRLGSWEDAFRHYTFANEIAGRIAPVRFSEGQLRRMYGERTRVFRDGPIARLAHGQSADAGKGLIFVVGMPRSGTTLVEQILASHPLVHGGGERPDIPNLIRALTLESVGGKKYPGCLASLDQVTADRLAASYLELTARLAGGKAHFVDKLPTNFWDLGLIRSLFPAARIVHCTRDPVDTCLSCYMQNFKYLYFSSDLRHIATYYKHYREMMAFWARVDLGGIHEVRYEDIVSDPRSVVRSLLGFCGLSWDDGCLSFHGTRRHVTTASWGQVRSPLYTSSVGKWRNYERFMGEVISAVGAV